MGWGLIKCPQSLHQVEHEGWQVAAVTGQARAPEGPLGGAPKTCLTCLTPSLQEVSGPHSKSGRTAMPGSLLCLSQKPAGAGGPQSPACFTATRAAAMEACLCLQETSRVRGLVSPWHEG